MNFAGLKLCFKYNIIMITRESIVNLSEHLDFNAREHTKNLGSQSFSKCVGKYKGMFREELLSFFEPKDLYKIATLSRRFYFEVVDCNQD